MGQELKVPEADHRERITNKEAFVEAAFELSYDIANWIEYAAHFFQVRFFVPLMLLMLMHMPFLLLL
jgi:hypothetical protein